MVKNLALGSILALLAPVWAPKTFFMEFTSTGCKDLLQVNIVCNFKENQLSKLEKMSKNGPNSGRQFFFPEIWLCQLEKTKDQILRKIIDGQTDRRTDESDFIGCCPTNVECPINKSSEETDFNNLTYHYTGKSAPQYFVRFKGPLIMYNDIKNDRLSLQKEEKIQEEFGSELSEILKVNLNYKSKEINKKYKKNFTMDGKKFLIFITIILEWFLMLDTNQFMDKSSKYYS